MKNVCADFDKFKPFIHNDERPMGWLKFMITLLLVAPLKTFAFVIWFISLWLSTSLIMLNTRSITYASPRYVKLLFFCQDLFGFIRFRAGCTLA